MNLAPFLEKIHESIRRMTTAIGHVADVKGVTSQMKRTLTNLLKLL
jgi:hypothetical protein